MNSSEKFLKKLAEISSGEDTLSKKDLENRNEEEQSLFALSDLLYENKEILHALNTELDPSEVQDKIALVKKKLNSRMQVSPKESKKEDIGIWEKLTNFLNPKIPIYAFGGLSIVILSVVAYSFFFNKENKSEVSYWGKEIQDKIYFSLNSGSAKKAFSDAEVTSEILLIRIGIYSEILEKTNPENSDGEYLKVLDKYIELLKKEGKLDEAKKAHEYKKALENKKNIQVNDKEEFYSVSKNGKLNKDDGLILIGKSLIQVEVAILKTINDVAATEGVKTSLYFMDTIKEPDRKKFPFEKIHSLFDAYKSGNGKSKLKDLQELILEIID